MTTKSMSASFCLGAAVGLAASLFLWWPFKLILIAVFFGLAVKLAGDEEA